MTRLFLVLLFLLVSVTYFNKSHSYRMPSNEETNNLNSPTDFDKNNSELSESSTSTSSISALNEIDGCPEDSIYSPAEIFDPFFQKNLIFNCLLEQKKEYVLTTEEGQKMFAMAYKNGDKLQLNSLNIFLENKLLEFRKYSTDGILQKWEVYNKEQQELFSFNQAAGKLEEFNPGETTPKRVCEQSFEDMSITDKIEDAEFKKAVKISSNDNGDIDTLLHVFHFSLKNNPKKFFNIKNNKFQRLDLNMELCLLSKTFPPVFVGELLFEETIYIIKENDQITLAVLKDLIKKSDVEVRDFLTSLADESPIESD